MTMKSKSGFCVRLDLEPGPNKGDWLVCDFRGGLSRACFHIPVKDTFVLENCQLIIKPVIARKIYKGSDKQVCAWVHCQAIKPGQRPHGKPILFDPRKSPHWHVGSPEGPVADWDVFECLVAKSGRLYWGK